jgi:hypothetical protein
MFAAHEPSDIGRFFRGLTEYAFHARLGIVDPPLVDYVALLLVRFLRNDGLELPSGIGQHELTDVTHMLLTVRLHAEADAAREEYRHIGDSTLFWSGLYPEALRRCAQPGRDDALLGYREAGKQAYWLASTLEPEDAAEERRLLERLSREYDLCVEGLAEVRRAWGDAA